MAPSASVLGLVRRPTQLSEHLVYHLCALEHMIFCSIAPWSSLSPTPLRESPNPATSNGIVRCGPRHWRCRAGRPAACRVTCAPGCGRGPAPSLSRRHPSGCASSSAVSKGWRDSRCAPQRASNCGARPNVSRCSQRETCACGGPGLQCRGPGQQRMGRQWWPSLF